ncbi:MAG: DNA polymerase III subunit delta [Paramuribaculum sp.]|nr:DNA polymerase III subunit delta [Paramuribaculum sp.]
MASAAVTFTDLKKSISRGELAPVYILHGEEGYYIDELAKQFESLVPADERDFNLYTLYAPETEPELIATTCRRFPIMADRQVVIVKEAQAARADQINKLHHYVASPTPSTVLVICFRGAVAKGKDLLAQARKTGIIFESKKLTDKNIDSTVAGIIKDLGLTVEEKGLNMLRDYIGLDVAKMYNELTKLSMILGKGAMVTPESIEQNIGISKDYNNFELVDAIASRNALKVYTIINYFRANPKKNPAILTASAVFAYFSSLLMCQFSRDKSPGALMALLDLKWQVQLRRFEVGMRNYNAYQTIEIISALRDFDVKCKGIGSRQSEFDLLHQLMHHILTAPGNITF